MAQEPQSPPIPLRLQADYQRLIGECQALRNKARSEADFEAWKAKANELLSYIRDYKKLL